MTTTEHTSPPDLPRVRTITIHVPEQDVVVEVRCAGLTVDDHAHLLDRFRAARFVMNTILQSAAPCEVSTPRLTVPQFDVGEIEEPDSRRWEFNRDGHRYLMTLWDTGETELAYRGPHDFVWGPPMAGEARP